MLYKSGRRLLLQLLHPNCSRYLSPDDLASLNLSIPSLSAGADSLTKSEKESQREERSGKEDADSDEEGTAAESVEKTSEGGKKDPSLRRRELLVNSGLAEVATGGSSGILYQTLNDKLKNLHEAIASLAAEPKSEESEEEHVLENFHSSHTIRKLVLDCPEFASTLWKKAFEGKCESWAQGHSSKRAVFSKSLKLNNRQMKIPIIIKSKRAGEGVQCADSIIVINQKQQGSNLFPS
ncbi:hypothetical protein SLE2022_238600 [Rubroshorea leprosula]